MRVYESDSIYINTYKKCLLCTKHTEFYRCNHRLVCYETLTSISLDVSEINDRKGTFFCIFIGPHLHSFTNFPVIREKNFTLIPYLLEEFGSSKISLLFRKLLLAFQSGNLVNIERVNVKLETG